MNDKPSLWWAYDEQSNSFSALPAGPFLLPALLAASVAVVCQKFRRNAVNPKNLISQSIYNSPEYQHAKQRYYYLINKKATENGLSIQEEAELWRLKTPWWANGGQWIY